MQLKLLDDLKVEKKIQDLNLMIKLLHNCLANKVCLKIVFYRIEKAKFKCSPIMKKQLSKTKFVDVLKLLVQFQLIIVKHFHMFWINYIL